ncbi:MAG TPA: hypothetical protein VMT43_11895, partial [Acidimicrobiales bacterium]|nr:hypothetical protein [Acidimicrobiales bacterium]
EVHEPDGQVLDSYGLLAAAWKARQQELDLPGDDPSVDPVTALGAVTGGLSVPTGIDLTQATGPPSGAPAGSSRALTVARNLAEPGGFPRYPDGSPVVVDQTPLPPPPY